MSLEPADAFDLVGVGVGVGVATSSLALRALSAPCKSFDFGSTGVYGVPSEVGACWDAERVTEGVRAKSRPDGREEEEEDMVAKVMSWKSEKKKKWVKERLRSVCEFCFIS